MERAKRRVRERRLGELATQVASISAELRHDPALAAAPGGSPAPPAYLERLSFKDGDHSVLVKTADLVWIEAEDYDVLIHARQDATWYARRWHRSNSASTRSASGGCTGPRSSTFARSAP